MFFGLCVVFEILFFKINNNVTRDVPECKQKWRTSCFFLIFVFTSSTLKTTNIENYKLLILVCTSMEFSGDSLIKDSISHSLNGVDFEDIDVVGRMEWLCSIIDDYNTSAPVELSRNISLTCASLLNDDIQVFKAVFKGDAILKIDDIVLAPPYIFFCTTIHMDKDGSYKPCENLH